MPTAEVRDITLFYDELGQGEPILWMHGFSGSHLGWLAQARAFGAAHRCIVYDHRDSGQSSESSRAYSIRDLADDAAALLDHLNIPRATVVGFSMGGAVAQEFAINHPDRLTGLALVATYTKGDPRGSDNLRSWARMRRSFPPEDFARATAPWVYTYREYLVPEFIENQIRRGLENPHWQSQEAYERQMEAVLAHDAEDRLDRIAAPCLVICGEDDILAPLRFSRMLAERIPLARLEVIPEVGHGLLWVKPAAVSEALDRFLMSVQQDPAARQ